MPRPALPSKHANPLLQQFETGPLPPVKYQILNCQGKDILVGRMKITTPSPGGHAFILRRFDTNAISLTTMFRAAFPSATDQEERRETNWVKENYNLAGFNGSSKDVNIIRLAGTWVSSEIATELGAAYSLGKIMSTIIQAVPDPNANYRRSGKAGTGGSAKSDSTPVSPSKTLPSPSPTAPTPNPAKKRKESSPAPVDVPSPSPVPRRSTRMKSVPPKPPSVRVSTRKSPRKERLATPETSDQTAVEDPDEGDAVASQDLHAEDVADQQKIIAGLRAQKESLRKETTVSRPLKRWRNKEEEALQFEFKEPEVGERAIATNRKISAFQMEPRTKSVAWGVAAFAVGFGAVSFLPNLF